MQKKIHAMAMRVMASVIFTLLATAPAEAALDAASKCEIYRTRVELKFAKCLDLANLLEFRDKASDRAKCSTKYDEGIATARRKLAGPWSAATEAACGLGQTFTDAAKALNVVAAGRDLADFGLETSDLHAGIDLQAWTEAAVAAAPGPESNDESICEVAGGIWNGGACSPDLSGYDCEIGAMCSVWAIIYPEELEIYANEYAGDAPGVGDAEFCTLQRWNEGRANLLPVWMNSWLNPYEHTSLVHAGGTYNICQRTAG